MNTYVYLPYPVSGGQHFVCMFQNSIMFNYIKYAQFMIFIAKKNINQGQNL